jgi:hypothetical protein
MFTDDQGKTHETPDEIGIERKLDLILAEIRKLEGAFPRNEDGSADLEGHKRFHDTKIKAAEAEMRFWQELKLDLAKKGAWGVMVVVVGLVILGLGAKLGITVK